MALVIVSSHAASMPYDYGNSRARSGGADAMPKGDAEG
jgi:hypothetical protein